MAIKVICSVCKKTLAKSELYVYKYVGEDKNLQGKIVGYAYPDGLMIMDSLRLGSFCTCRNAKPIFKGDSICKTEMDFEWVTSCTSNEVFLRFFPLGDINPQYFSLFERAKEWFQVKIEEFAKRMVNNWYFI